MRMGPTKTILISTLAAYGVGCRPSDVPARPEESPAAESVEAPPPVSESTLHNFLPVAETIFTGGEPHGEAAFAELAARGVRKVVSVDGARPDLDAAHAVGLKYVHIPIGYDGVPRPAGLALARLVREAEGAVYIHCHHGVHRGPAAAAIACVAAGEADGAGALAILERAGTSRDYAGLWRDVEAYVLPAEGEPLPDLVEVAEVDSLAAAMAAVDRASDNLKLTQTHNWRTPPDHPDVEPVQQALLLREAFHEIGRQLAKENPYDDRFAAWIAEAEQSAAELELAAGALGRADDAFAASDAFTQVQSQCKRCHAEYRN